MFIVACWRDQVEGGGNVFENRVGSLVAVAILTGSLVSVVISVNAAELSQGMALLEEVSPGEYVVVDLTAVVIETTAPGFGDTVSNGAITVPVPSAGLAVDASTMVVAGDEVSLTVATALDGVVTVYPSGVGGASAPDPSEATGGADECSDAQASPNPWTWSSAYHWKFEGASTPSYLSVNEARDKLIEATKNITLSRNACGMDDRVDATQVYDGKTSVAAGVGRFGDCTGPNGGDGINVTSFADIDDKDPATGLIIEDSFVLASTCTWYLGSNPLDSDTRINSGDFLWYLTLPADCVSAGSPFALEGVVTHERGHTFGLAHVNEKDHGYLTMSRYVNGPCQNSESTLGKGDVLGLRDKY